MVDKRLVKFFLRHWQHYVRDHTQLSQSEKKCASQLFRGLQQCTEETRRLLYEKYCTGRPSLPDVNIGLCLTNIERPDRELIELHGVGYPRQRLNAEEELREHLSVIVDADIKKAKHYHLRVGSYYITAVDDGKIQLDKHSFKALEFNGDDEYIKGFERVPIQDGLEYQ